METDDFCVGLLVFHFYIVSIILRGSLILGVAE